MTGAQYLEMCQMMGTEPIESEIPVELEDFPTEVQVCFSIYNVLQDNWDSFSGEYLGKNLTNLQNLLDIYEIPVPERIFYLKIIYKIDEIRSGIISAKHKEKLELKKAHQ